MGKAIVDTLRYAKPLEESTEKTGTVVMGRKTFAIGNRIPTLEITNVRFRYLWRKDKRS